MTLAQIIDPHMNIGQIVELIVVILSVGAFYGTTNSRFRSLSDAINGLRKDVNERVLVQLDAERRQTVAKEIERMDSKIDELAKEIKGRKR